MARSYYDFAIRFSSLDKQRYHVSVSGPGGEAEGLFTPPFDDPAFQTWRQCVALDENDTNLSRVVGQKLFQALITGDIFEVYTRSQEQLAEGEALRVRLIFPTQDGSDIASLPWELLAEPEGAGPFVLLDTSVVRSLQQRRSIPPLAVAPPLRVLLTAAETLPPANVATEFAAAGDALHGLSTLIEVTPEPHLTRKQLEARVRQPGTFHIWHFTGHGGIATDALGFLVFEDAQGDAEQVNSDELAIMLYRSGIRLVVLDSCDSANVAGDLFRSFAPALIRADIPAVIAMQRRVSSESTHAFATAFYHALASGEPLDACMTMGRWAIMYVAGLHVLDWSTPTLYTRVKDTHLFVTPTPSALPAPLPVVRNEPPYLGLEAFQEQHAQWFFGRTAMVQKLVDHLRATKFLAVLGASGSGKSSVVRAGLVPALKQGALPQFKGMHYLIIRPGLSPLTNLAGELSRLHGGSLESKLALARELAADPGALRHAATLISGSEGKLILIIDQAEELWSLEPTDPTQRAAWQEREQQPFLDLITSVGTTFEGPLVVILALRSDFFHRTAEHAGLREMIAEHDVIVGAMDESELTSAIVEPAQLAGCRFEPGLADQLIREVRGEPGALPLLQYTLLELWKRRGPDGLLSWEALRAIDGVAGALSARAKTIFESTYTTEQERESVRHMLLRLVQIGDGAPDTRLRVPIADLTPSGGSTTQVRKLLDPLIEARLLTTNRDETLGRETIELAHEALIRGWPRLRDWIDATRADLQLERQLAEAAREWKRNDEDRDYLWSGQRYAVLKAWVDRVRPVLNEREQRFIAASRAAQPGNIAERVGLSVAGGLFGGGIGGTVTMAWFTAVGSTASINLLLGYILGGCILGSLYGLGFGVGHLWSRYRSYIATLGVMLAGIGYASTGFLLGRDYNTNLLVGMLSGTGTALSVLNGARWRQQRWRVASWLLLGGLLGILIGVLLSGLAAVWIPLSIGVVVGIGMAQERFWRAPVRRADRQGSKVPYRHNKRRHDNV